MHPARVQPRTLSQQLRAACTQAGAIAWADRHSVGKYCHADGSRLSWLPDNTFDAVVSYAALYHIPRELQCETLKQLIRITRPGGRLIIGWNGSHERVEPGWWEAECF